MKLTTTPSWQGCVHGHTHSRHFINARYSQQKHYSGACKPSAGAGYAGAGGGWGHPSRHFPGNDHMALQSLLPQLTYFLLGSRYPVPLPQEPAQRVPGAELTTSTPSSPGPADSPSAVPTPPPQSAAGGRAGKGLTSETQHAGRSRPLGSITEENHHQL